MAEPDPTQIFECNRAADLVRAIRRVIENMGGTVLMGPSNENLCRRATPAEMEEFGGQGWVVEAQGLPNLIHELVHALFLGHLADDHGFDYQQIPLDMERPEHREHLWEELSCCALSTTTCAPLFPDPEAFSRAWFTEQFEIQGVFHGLEGDLDAFRAHVGGQLAHPNRRAELERTVARGRALLESALREADPRLEIPPCDVIALWDEYLIASARNPAKTGRVASESP